MELKRINTVFSVLAVLFVGYVSVSAYFRTHYFSALSRNDDSFITYRYAENLAAGKGFVFNDGEKVLGTTTPLYTLLLAGARLILPGADMITMSVVMNYMFHSLAMLFLLLLLYKIIMNGEDIDVRVSLIAAAVFFLTISLLSEFLTTLVYGMEIGLVSCLAALSLYFLNARKMTPLAICLFLLFFTRIDTVFLIAFCMSYAAFLCSDTSKKTKLWALALFSGLSLMYMIITIRYFGSFIPNSVFAKNLYYNIYRGDATPRFWFVKNLFNEGMLSGWHTIVIFALFLSGAIYAFLQRNYLLILCVLTFVSYFLYLALFRVTATFNWYLPQYMPLYYLVASIGVIALGKAIARGSRRLSISVLMSALCVVLLSVIAPAALGKLKTNKQVIDRNFPPDDGLILLGKYIKSLNIGSNEIVAIGDIGKVSYYSGAKIMDTVGLVSPQVFKYYRNKTGLRGVIKGEMPDYVLVHKSYLQAYTDEEREYLKWFYENYEFLINSQGLKVEEIYCAYKKRTNNA